MKNPDSIDRRRLLEGGAAVTSLAAFRSLSPAVFASGDDRISVGLIGCGGRGTGAAAQALRADPGCRLVAMADAFEDRLTRSLDALTKSNVKERVEVKPEQRFVGFEAGRKLIESGVDVVLLAEPPHFRPHHLRLAVEAGKHVFFEKPVAVDGPGVRSVLESARLAKQKRLSLVGGLCWRYDFQKRATIQHVLDGGIGEIVAMQATYNTSGLWHHARKPGMSDMEWQLRNWLYFTWLSGDHITEQHVHSLDKLAWAMGDEYPVRCTASGGRQVRTDPKFGHVYDHFNTVYEWKNGVKGFSSCRQMDGCANDVSDHIMGTLGRCEVFKHRVVGEKPWAYKGPRNAMYQQEHDELFASIRKQEPLNDGEYMAKSTLMAIMARMSAYSGQVVTFEEALASNDRLGPQTYAWGELPVPPVALPGLGR